jgi:UPF0271 protein
MPHLDFNCDLGEGCGSDADIVPLISSASIACGAHAGDAGTMRAAIRLCRDHGVAIGAHPSFEDREHFGRRELVLDHDEIARLVRTQLARLAAIAHEEGTRIAHVKPHGALYNLAARDRDVADAIAGGIVAFDSSLMLYGLSGSRLTAAGEAAGLRVAHEVFAERAYDADGTLASRGTPGAVIEDLDAALAQVRTLLREGVVVARDGSRVPLRADTLCLHGDRADAAGFARALRKALDADGILIAAPGVHL